MQDNDSCGSRVVASYEQLQKAEVYDEVLRRLKESLHPEVEEPDFADQLWAHFNRFPARYALHNVKSPEDVLMHKRLLHLAQDPANLPAFEVRIVQDPPVSDVNSGDSVHSSSPRRGSIHPPPASGSSPNLETLALEESTPGVQNGNNDGNVGAELSRPMHEITFSTNDKPSLLNQLTSVLGEIGLNIKEAHAFNTEDGYSLDVFVVKGRPLEEVDQLRDVIGNEVLKIQTDHVKIPDDGTDVWEIDPQCLTFESKVASGSCGDLYKGTYRSQEVAIKVLKAEGMNTESQREFAQEVFIMRKVRHKNVVQFIGACTKPPNICIMTEFMPRGSVYDYLRNKGGKFKLPALLKAAIDIAKGMNYLHQNNIIHRDLKAANLLMDENDVIKICDFGVARVIAPTGVMTAETGTYRWMAPEVIAHKPYNHKADIFSYGVVLWELLTGKIPYDLLTPLQAAVGVVESGLRPKIPKKTHPQLAELLKRCWQKDPTLRPDFSEIMTFLQQLSEEVGDGEDDKVKKKTGGFFSSLKRGQHSSK